MKRNWLVIFSSLLTLGLFAQQKTTIDEYIEKWSMTAVKHKDQHGIPASITLAQGILESGFGNSMLAREGNNHFGIKCHDWKGEQIFKDDDKKNECFRKYEDAAQSFEDHALFLVNRKRYSELFEYNVTDYKKWAKGLKNAGYATNPKYPKLLIDLIEKHQLNEFDKLSYADYEHDQLLSERSMKLSDDIEGKKPKREILYNNKVKYVVANDGDTFYQIAKEMGLTLRQLHKYNDFPPYKDHLEKGDMVYIMPKRKKADLSRKNIVLTNDMKAWEVSQKYGIKLTTVLSANNLSQIDEQILGGTKVALR